MRLKTSSTIIVFAGITGACAIFGGIAQISQNLASGRLEQDREKSLTHIAQEVQARKCRRSDGGLFQKNQIIPEDGGRSPTSCYENEFNERAFVAYEGGKLVIKEVYTAYEVEAKISQMKQKEKKNEQK